MTKYHVQAPDGKTVVIEGPAGASEAEVLAQAQSLYNAKTAAPAPPKKASLLDAAIHSIDSGILSSFNDEYMAAGNALLPPGQVMGGGVKNKSVWDGTPWGEAFKHNVAAQRAYDAQLKKDRPVTSAVGTTAGATLQALVGGKLLGSTAQAAATAHPILSSTLVGAGQGYASGYGAGDTPASRKKSAALGALSGGAIGGAGGVIITKGLPLVARYWNSFRGKGTEQEAVSQIARALARDGYDVSTTAGKNALQAELSRFTGKPVSLADMGGNVRARAGVGLRSPGRGQAPAVQAVRARAQGAPERLSADIRANVAPRTDVHALDDALVTQRREAALPLRDKAMTESALNYANPTKTPTFITSSPYTSEELQALKIYKEGGDPLGDGSYMNAEAINRAMRGEGEVTPAMQSVITNIKSALAKTKLAAPARVYRGMQALTPESGFVSTPPTVSMGEPLASPQLNSFGPRDVAKEFTDYSPTSGGLNGANGGQYDNPSRFFRVDLPEGAPAGDLLLPGTANHLSKEQEYLTGPGKLFFDKLRGNANTVQVGFGKFVPEGVNALRNRVPQDNVLQQIARLPLAQRSLERARQLAAGERDLLNATGQDVSHLPDFPETGAPLDMKSLDYMKQTMDKEINELYTAGRGADASALKQVRDALRERMRAASPEYGAYLDQYSDSSEMIDALRAGRGGGGVPGFDKLDPEAIAAGQAGRSTAAQELFRVGAARRLTDIVDDTADVGSAIPANRILNTPNAVRRVEALGVEPANMQALQQAVGQERQLAQLPGELTGSATDARLAARADADVGMHASTPFNPTSLPAWIAWAARKAAGKVDLSRNAAVNEQALPRLLEQNPQAIQNIVAELEAVGRVEEAATVRRAAQAKFGAAVFGNMIGSPVALPEGN